MTLDELTSSLPNGLHDSRVLSLRIDYVRREVAFDVSVWIGDPSSRDRSVRETYRPAVLILSGLLYCVIEPPDSGYPYDRSGYLWIDAGSVESLSTPTESNLPSTLPVGAFSSWFFVRQWNAFIYVAANGASLTWSEEPGANETI